MSEPKKGRPSAEPTYADLFNAVPIGLYRTTPEGGIEDANPAMIRMLGCSSKNEVLNLRSADLYADPQDRSTWQALIEEQGTVANFEVRLKRPDGKVIWVRENANATRDSKGRLLYYEGSLEPISAEKKAKEDTARQAKVLEAINRVLTETIICQSEEEVASTCLTVAEELTGSRFGFIGELNKDNRLDTIALSNPGWQACRLPQSQTPVMIRNMEIRGIWGRVIKDGEPLLVNDPASHPDRVGTPKGHPRLTSFLGVPLQQDGKTIGLISLANKEGGYGRNDLENITSLSISFLEALQRKRTEQTLQESEERFHAIADTAKDAIIMINSEGCISYWNLAAQDIFGYTAQECMGRDLHPLLAPPKYYESYTEGFNNFRATGAGAAIGQTLELEGIRKGGDEFPLELSLAAVHLDGRWHAVGIVRDITQRKKMELELQRLSYMDGLTGVANRRQFEKTLNLEWRRLTREKGPLAIIMADIDFFKAYNDTYGHQKGDDCLQQIAAGIRQALKRPADFVARYGGEEFVVILPGTDKKGALGLAETLRAAIESLNIPHATSRVSGNVTLSLGVAAAIPDKSVSPKKLVAAADRALYQAKKEGRNSVIG